MTKLVIALVLLTSPLAGQAVHANQVKTGTPAPIAKLVENLTAPELTWEERFQAEEKLMKMPSEPVLVALVPEIAKGMPSDFGIWNGTGSAQLDRKLLPPKWQVFYAVHRVWNHHDLESFREEQQPLASVGRALVAYLSKARSQATILNELGASGRSYNYWIEEAEEPVSALFRDVKNDSGVRLTALKCLLRNTGEKYYVEAKEVAQAWPEQPWQQLQTKAALVRMLMEVGLRNRKGADKMNVDPEVLKIGFSLLPQLEKLTKGGGYFLALSLGTYVGQEFKADQSNPKYKGEHGLTDSFFADTTTNALTWWTNRDKSKS